MSHENLSQAYRRLRATLTESTLPGELNEETFEKLGTYVGLIQKWGRTINLVGSLDNDELHLNVCDCLGAWMALRTRIQADGCYLDVGSGAGLPGMVFQIMEPERQVFLCEPRFKRATFLQQVKVELSLPNMTVLNERLERIQGIGAEFAMVSARAVGDTALLLRESRRFLRAGGVIAEFVGPSWDRRDEEMERSLGLSFQAIPYPSLADSRNEIALWSVPRET